MERYNEDEIITISYCNYLYYLGGNINQLSVSQLLFKDLILKLNHLILNKQLKNIDLFLNKYLKTLIKKYYSEINTIDDLSYLHSFYSQLFFKYISLFPIEKYVPGFIDYKPILKMDDIELKLNLDLILIQQNKDAYYHLICFAKDLDEFNIKNNPLNYFKLKLLRKIHTKQKRRREPVKIHFLYVPTPTFRNRNQRDYRLKYLTIDLEDYKEVNTSNFKSLFKNYNKVKPKPRFYCNEKNCTKRKECLNANLR